ncbi:hypothetical protein V1512DRAFT_230747 [Lipomyces arxii]|uniref:uncharacterized protein n=1 Tax=Lipomyces arxii TaxID=56418 RepID=UPI0034CF0682
MQSSPSVESLDSLESDSFNSIDSDDDATVIDPAEQADTLPAFDPPGKYRPHDNDHRVVVEVQERRSKKKPREYKQTLKQQSANTVYLYLISLNNTFNRKCLKIPFFPQTMLLGRQLNTRTAPTPDNGYFDTKVLSRQHAEIWADRTGQVWIRDIKSANGTFINGTRLSDEGEESEPHKLVPDDVLDLGINISGDDSKSVAHSKISAKVDKVLFVPGSSQPISQTTAPAPTRPLTNSSSINLSYADIEPGSRQQPHLQPAHLLPSLKSAQGKSKQQRIISRILNPTELTTKGPIALDMIVKKVATEYGHAKAQAADLARTTELLANLIDAQHVSFQTATTGCQVPAVHPPAQTDETNALAAALALAEQQLKESDHRLAAVKSAFERESHAREQAESKLALAQEELKLEREQAISDLRAEEAVDQASVTPLASDTIALIENAEIQRRRRRSSSSSESDVSDDSTSSVMSHLKQANRDIKLWKTRAVKAEYDVEQKNRMIDHLIKQLQQGSSPRRSPASSPARRSRSNSIQPQSEGSRSQSRESQIRSRSNSIQSPPLKRTVTLRPEKSLATTTTTVLKRDTIGFVAPMVATVGTVLMGLGVMSLLNVWT